MRNSAQETKATFAHTRGTREARPPIYLLAYHIHMRSSADNATTGLSRANSLTVGVNEKACRVPREVRAQSTPPLVVLLTSGQRAAVNSTLASAYDDRVVEGAEVSSRAYTRGSSIRRSRQLFTYDTGLSAPSYGKTAPAVPLLSSKGAPARLCSAAALIYFYPHWLTRFSRFLSSVPCIFGRAK